MSLQAVCRYESIVVRAVAAVAFSDHIIIPCRIVRSTQARKRRQNARGSSGCAIALLRGPSGVLPCISSRHKKAPFMLGLIGMHGRWCGYCGGEAA